MYFKILKKNKDGCIRFPYTDTLGEFFYRYSNIPFNSFSTVIKIFSYWDCNLLQNTLYIMRCYAASSIHAATHILPHLQQSLVILCFQTDVSNSNSHINTLMEIIFTKISWQYNLQLQSIHKKQLPMTLAIMKVLRIGQIYHIKQLSQNMTKKTYIT